METASTDFDRLAELCAKAIAESYEESERPSAAARLQQELAFVQQIDRAKEFLLASQVLQFARREGIAVHMTGAACGSIISHLLGISNIEPLRHGLLFERFLDPEGRWAMPFVMDVEAECKERLEEFTSRSFSGEMARRFHFQSANNVLLVPHRIARQIRQSGAASFDLGEIPLDDTDAFHVLAEADCFQKFPFLNEEIMFMLPFFQPTSITDIAWVCVGVFVGDNYAHLLEEEEERLSAVHPAVMKVLDKSQDRIYYQEQIMVLLNQLGGVSLANAYVFIKATTERDWTTVDFYRKKFLAGADKLENSVAMDLVNWLEDAAQYACCKADEICQAIRIYQAAYLKVHHPVEFNQVVQAFGY